MTMDALQYVGELLENAGINYQFMRWEVGQTGIPPDCYFVGEYMESPSLTLEENGFLESTFVLRGFTRGAWLLLEESKAKIEQAVPKTVILPSGAGIAVFYDSAIVVPTGDDELKSIKINLKIQEWKVK